MAHVVSGPCALIDCLDGRTATIMRGGPVPENVDPEHLEHLLAVGLVTAVDEGDEVGGDDPDVSGPPAQVAAKEEWVAYAVSQGLSQVDAEAMTKAQLIEQYKA